MPHTVRAAPMRILFITETVRALIEDPGVDQPNRLALETQGAGGLPVEYHESDAAHHIDPAHVPPAVDWVAATLARE